MNVSLVSRRIGIHALDPRSRPYARISAVILLLSLLGGCTSAPKLPTPPAPPTQDARDGVPVNPGIDVEKIPDAVVRAEPRSPYGNPVSYEIGSQRYYPLDDATGFVESGIASWYGSKFHGRRTSSGEIYDAWKMTAAHKTLPLPTYVSVQDIESGKKVVVKVNDRGPFYPDRIIDLSYAAAAKLGIAKKGTGLVEIRALTPKDDPPSNRPSDEKATVSASAKPRSMVPAAASKPAAASASIAVSAASPTKIAAKSVPKSAPSPSPPAVIQKEALPLPSPSTSASASAPVSASASTPVSASASTPVSASASTPVSTSASTPVSTSTSTPVSASASTPASASTSTPTPSTTQFTVARSAAKSEADSGSSLKKAMMGVFLQIASFRRQANAARLRDRLLGMAVESVHTKEFRHRGQRYYRVRVGPLPSRQSAKEVAGSLRSLGLGEPLIVSE